MPMHLVVFIIYTGIVTVASLTPGGDVSFAQLDKLMHLLVYYIFAVFGYRALRDKRLFPWLCLGIVAYGALLEFGQSYVPGRETSAYDLVANIGGVLLGALVMTRRHRGA